jgi:hypothetical protein
MNFYYLFIHEITFVFLKINFYLLYDPQPQ